MSLTVSVLALSTRTQPAKGFQHIQLIIIRFSSKQASRQSIESHTQLYLHIYFEKILLNPFLEWRNCYLNYIRRLWSRRKNRANDFCFACRASCTNKINSLFIFMCENIETNFCMSKCNLYFVLEQAHSLRVEFDTNIRQTSRCMNPIFIFEQMVACARKNEQLTCRM